jgi:hypothetical protein
MHYDYETCTEGDCALCNEIANRGLKTTISPIQALGDLLIDAVTRLNDKIDNFKPTVPNTPVDLSAITAQFATERDAVQAKLDAFAAAVDNKFVQMVVDHAVPAVAGATVSAFDPKVLDPIKTDLAAVKTKVDAVPTIWTGTKAQYDALTTKDPGTVYFIQ